MSDYTKCLKCANSRNCTKKGDDLDSRSCKSFIELDTFKQPVLAVLLQSNDKDTINNTHHILTIYGLKIVEDGKHPYFRLVLNA